MTGLGAGGAEAAPAPQPAMSSAVHAWLEENKGRQIELLREAVAIPSVSAWETHRVHSEECAQWFAKRLEGLGFAVEFRQPTVPSPSSAAAIPRVICARLPAENPLVPTVLIYGHIDVQPAAKSDGWDTEPFALTEKDGRLYGRGSTDDKGPVLAWTNAIEAMRACGVPLPVNPRFILEGMEESGSEGLEDLMRGMRAERDGLFAGVDHCVISDSYWLGNERPCVSYGLRGNSCYHVTVECAQKDLHSGSYGGLINEAMADLVHILDRLVDRDGKILIPGIYDQVRAVSAKELATYEKINFDVEERKRDMATGRILNEQDPARVMQAMWRHPTLSIHGIEGAFSEAGFKTVIPAKVTGKFSLRIVPDMGIPETEALVLQHLERIWQARKSANKATFTCVSSGRWFLEDPDCPNYRAARNAMQVVYGHEAALIREGGSIPITLVIRECAGTDVCLLPIGCSNDGAHSQNEKIDVVNYVNGAKVMAEYFAQLAALKAKQK